jgi:hypothetical protein
MSSQTSTVSLIHPVKNWWLPDFQTADGSTIPINYDVGRSYSENQVGMNWLIKDLELAPGEPSMLVGQPEAGKTWAAQSIAVAVASGVDLWGSMKVRTGYVLHLSYEQQKALVIERYERLCAGLGLRFHGADGVGSRIATVNYPGLYLDSPTMQPWLLLACRGADLVIIDAFNSALQVSDENHSSVGRCLRMLASVSHQTGSTFLALHHMTKPREVGASNRLAMVRGSSAIVGACQVIYTLTGDARNHRTLTCAKSRMDGFEKKTLIMSDWMDDSEEFSVRKTTFRVGIHGEEATIEGSADIKAAIVNVLSQQGESMLNQTMLVTRVRAEAPQASHRAVTAMLNAMVKSQELMCTHGKGPGSPLLYFLPTALDEVVTSPVFARSQGDSRVA